MTRIKTNRIKTLSWINTLGRANTQVRPYDNDMTGRVKLVGADLCVCPDYWRLFDDTHKNKPKKTLSWINTLGRANTQVCPYENDMTGRVKLAGQTSVSALIAGGYSMTRTKTNRINTLLCINTLGRVKLVGADLCVCPDYWRLSDDTQKNEPDKYVIMD